jgi:hypothetical protein
MRTPRSNPERKLQGRRRTITTPFDALIAVSKACGSTATGLDLEKVAACLGMICELEALGLKVVAPTLPQARPGRAQTRPNFYRAIRDVASVVIVEEERASLQTVVEALNRYQFPDMKAGTIKRYLRWAWIDAKYVSWREFKRAVLRAHRENLARNKAGAPTN